MGTARNHRFFGVMTYLLFEKESLKTLPMYTLSALLSALIFDFHFRVLDPEGINISGSATLDISIYVDEC